MTDHHGPMPEEQYQAELDEIRGRYPADVMDGPERSAYVAEMNDLYYRSLQYGADEWEKYLGDYPCKSCEHFRHITDRGDVLCHGIVVDVGGRRKRTWRFRRPFAWYVSCGRKTTSCTEYKKAKGQTRMEV